jgi:hypothetical protein
MQLRPSLLGFKRAGAITLPTDAWRIVTRRAPFVGPATVDVGEAADANVMCLGAFGGLYDSGAFSISHDMLVGLHKGEMVIPQRGGIADDFVPL